MNIRVRRQLTRQGIRRLYLFYQDPCHLSALTKNHYETRPKSTLGNIGRKGVVRILTRRTLMKLM